MQVGYGTPAGLARVRVCFERRSLQASARSRVVSGGLSATRKEVCKMRARLRDAWAAKGRDLVRVVLGGLGGQQGLSQLWTRRAKHVTIRRPSDRWRELVMRHLALGHLPAGEGKRLLDAEEGMTEDPDFDVWLAAVASESPELARRIDEATVCATWHAFDCLLQLICSDEKAWELIADIPAQKLMRRAARILDHDAEVHITWARH